MGLQSFDQIIWSKNSEKVWKSSLYVTTLDIKTNIVLTLFSNSKLNN